MFKRIIRSPWVRRPLVVLIVAVGGTLLLVVRACEVMFECVDEAFGDEIRRAWEGPVKRG